MKTINPMDLVKNQDTDASKWAKAFLETFNPNNFRTFPDEADMIGWFANAIMTAHDKQANKYEALLKEEGRRCLYWENTARDYSRKWDLSQSLLTEAHAIIGRSAHALSYRWDTMPLTVYMKDTPGRNHTDSCENKSAAGKTPQQ